MRNIKKQCVLLYLWWSIYLIYGWTMITVPTYKRCHVVHTRSFRRWKYELIWKNRYGKKNYISTSMTFSLSCSLSYHPNCFHCISMQVQVCMEITNRCDTDEYSWFLHICPHLREIYCFLRYLTECMGLKDDKETLSKMYDAMRRKYFLITTFMKLLLDRLFRDT